MANTLSEVMGTVWSEDVDMSLLFDHDYISEGAWGGSAFGGQYIFYFEEDTMFSYVLSCRHKLNL